MSELRQALQDYLAVRRALGFKLARADQRLSGFIGYLEQTGARTVTTELALAWSCQPPGGHPAWWRQRLILVRGFAKYLHALDPATEVPGWQARPAPAGSFAGGVSIKELAEHLGHSDPGLHPARLRPHAAMLTRPPVP